MICNKTKIIDVDKKIIEFMEKALFNARDLDLDINWKEFEEYCKGFYKEPHILNVPVSVIDRCLKQINRTKWKINHKKKTGN